MQPYVIYKLFKEESDDSIIAKVELYNRDLSTSEINELMEFFDADYFE